MRSQRGYIQLILLGVLALVALGGGYAIVRTYNGAIEAKAEAIKERDVALQALQQSQAETVRAEAEKAAAELVHQASLERAMAAHERQLENEARKERAVTKASAEKIAATSARDAKKYEEFVHKALPRNIEALECRSNLRTVHDPNACPITVR